MIPKRLRISFTSTSENISRKGSVCYILAPVYETSKEEGGNLQKYLFLYNYFWIYLELNSPSCM